MASNASPSRNKETKGCGIVPFTTIMVFSIGVMKAKLAVVIAYCVPGLFGSRGGYIKYPSVRKRRTNCKMGRLIVLNAAPERYSSTSTTFFHCGLFFPAAFGSKAQESGA